MFLLHAMEILTFSVLYSHCATVCMSYELNGHYCRIRYKREAATLPAYPTCQPYQSIHRTEHQSLPQHHLVCYGFQCNQTPQQL